ncbi:MULTISPECIES: uracil-DNA glycosylase family protein [Enterobacterales]|uniref:Uracil-DNA glycosylase n=1 Tax=Pantoea dispersa TaxID=59814 RepID=A0ABY2ZUX2_9GAMM|nr:MULTISPECIES: uracil-DNA glycosylase family protein [Enterobacterales]MCQ0899218.1 uracil-DNA glycosylase [Klebsiella pneumoniae]TQC70060.1 uracil-DNA glycosylase [Pantoea dispersa]
MSETCTSLLDPFLREERLAAVIAPHVAALNRWVSGQNQAGVEVPWFDPADGGAGAGLLVLLQSPARSSPSPRFVSRDNPGPAQQNLGRFLAEAGIARQDSVLWNTVPWVSDGPQKRPSAVDIRTGCAWLEDVLAHLPALRVVVLAGAVAAQARGTVSYLRPGVTVLTMPHPSPLSLCTSPTVPENIRRVLREARAVLTG